MATATEAIVLITPGLLVGPGTEFEKQRLALQQEVAALLTRAKGITVASLETAEQATACGRVLQVAEKEREKFFKEIKTQIDAVKKPVLEAEKADIGLITAEKTRLGSELTAWNEKQRKIREEAERVAREAAEKQAREDQLNLAIELEAAGDLEQAEAVLEEPVMAPVVIQSIAPPKVAGQVGRISYSMEVTDLVTLMKAVIAGTAPIAAIQANESYLNSKARLDKEGYSVPGTRLIKKSATSFRS